MAVFGPALRFPDIKEIIHLNQLLIERYGGNFNGLDNLLNRNSLEWVLDIIQHPLFVEDQYPTVIHKAAILAWIIIDGHVFYDGNKRTSMFAAIRFLQWNGYQLDVTPQEIIDISLQVANKHESGITYNNLVQWFIDHIRPFS